ncbi:hypothetical protein AB3S75_010597 [Citrus x aurantiifolia]
MALCPLQEIGLANDVLVDEQDISAPVPPAHQAFTEHTGSQNSAIRYLLTMPSLVDVFLSNRINILSVPD